MTAIERVTSFRKVKDGKFLSDKDTPNSSHETRTL